ncbi:MAG: alpha/beta hydrolase, partial [Anaerococcus prevotii]|nr:alpha/beta hydrolase [Anaerococcus prevotii]
KKNIYGAAEKYKGKVLILRGDADDLVFNDANVKLQKAYPNAVYEQIEGADHSFKNEDHRMIVFKKMYKFFEEN